MKKQLLTELEREVESARAKLSTDLSTLRSPATAAEFTGTLKQEALDTKDELVEKAKTTVQASIDSFVEDVKARAAANPAAAVMIGAGVAWQLVRRPPIATTLIGAGLLSLFRTAPAQVNGRTSADYLSHAQNRLKDQAAEAADTAKEKLSGLAGNVAETATQTMADLKDRAQDVVSEATNTAGRVVGSIQQEAASIMGQTTEIGERAKQSARSRPGQNGEQLRDNVLLGAASLAVVAALAISSQKRVH
jgi:hypothetical protein